jgi:hypothetical protein
MRDVARVRELIASDPLAAYVLTAAFGSREPMPWSGSPLSKSLTRHLGLILGEDDVRGAAVAVDSLRSNRELKSAVQARIADGRVADEPWTRYVAQRRLAALVDPGEYRTGDPEETWGAIRRDSGLSRAFDLRMLDRSDVLPDVDVLLGGGSRHRARCHVVDVGGGPGQYTAQLLAALGPNATGTLFDMYPDAGWYVREVQPALTGRIDIQVGDPMGELPGGGDLYFLASLLHDLSDASALDLLERCSAAAADGSAIVVVERNWDRRSLPDSARDLDMQLLFGGQERTDDELSALLAGSGFEVTCVLRTGNYLALSGRLARSRDREAT